MRNEKMLALILTIFLLMAAVAVLAMTSYVLYFPQEAVVLPPSPEVSVYVDGQPWSNGTKISWNPVEPGKSYTKNLEVENVGNTTVKVFLMISGLPEGWSLTWSANGSILHAGEKCSGYLTLTVPPDASGPYEWDSWIIAEPAE